MIGAIRRIWWPYSAFAHIAAKHETGHALVASVLGQSFVEVYIQDPRLHQGKGGGVINDPPSGSISDFPTLCLAILKDITVHLSGVLGEQNWETIEMARLRLHGQSDLSSACGLMRAFALIRSDLPDVGNDLFKAARDDMASGPWRTAIAEGSKALLGSGGAPVRSDRFRTIAREHNLRMPAVAQILAGLG